MKWTLPASLIAHLLLLALIFPILAPRQMPAPPANPPQVEVVMGDAALEPGSPIAPTPAPDPQDTPQPPPPAPPPAPQPAAPDTPPPPPPPPNTPAPTEAVPPPPPPPPPPQPAPAPAPAPSPVPPAPPTPDTPPPAPTPPTPTPAAPDVRLGPLEMGFSRIDDPDKVTTQAQPDKGNLPPIYPREAERRGQQGTVVLRIHVDPDGNATAVDVISSSGYPALDAAARARLATWRFQPGRRQDGTPAPDVIEIGINFQLH